MPDTPPVPEPGRALPADVAARIRATAPRGTTPALAAVPLRLVRLPPRESGGGD